MATDSDRVDRKSLMHRSINKIYTDELQLTKYTIVSITRLLYDAVELFSLKLYCISLVSNVCRYVINKVSSNVQLNAIAPQLADTLQSTPILLGVGIA